MRTINFIDLFAGGGGLSEGFHREGYNPIAHVEEVSDACDTLMTRQGYYFHKEKGTLVTYFNYLKGKVNRNEYYNTFKGAASCAAIINERIGADALTRIFEKIDEKLNEGKVDLIIGGPPCQAYSVIGRSRIGKDNLKNDSRLNLYKQYNKFLNRYKPKLFVFENVRGLLSLEGGSFFQRIEKSFIRQGYYITTIKVNAKDFGVLQDRKRLIIVGIRKDIGELSILKELNLTESSIERAKLKSIFYDLPSVSPGENLHIAKYKNNYVNKYLFSSGIRNGMNFTTQHFARSHNERDLEIYKIAIKEWNTNKKRIRYNDLPTKLITHKNLSGFLDRFKVVAADLDVSQTVVAHICKDGHYFIHPDIKQCRSITVREAARIQSFPDDYFFEGSRTSVFRQIGNAVPPLMSFGIAKSLKKLLR